MFTLIRRRKRALWLSMLVMLSLSSHAHVNHDESFRPVLDKLPKELGGISVQLTDTLAPQLLLENRSASVITILGQNQQPFLRISRDRVEANTRHPDWLKTYLPGGLPGRKPEPGHTPLWKQVKASNSWGWFDSRLQPAQANADSVWQVPVLIGNMPSAITGRFTPAQLNGYWQANWRVKPTLPNGISIALIPGQPYGVMLANKSNAVVTVLDPNGKPFIRVSKAGTEASLKSTFWRETAAQQGLRNGGQDHKDWQLISTAPRYTWIEPRTRGKQVAKKPLTWTSQLLVDEQLVTLKGESRWLSKR